MTTLQLTSFILLWIVIIVEGALLLVLYRHVALTYTRRITGLAVNTAVPPLTARTPKGEKVTLTEMLSADYNLWVFGSEGCSGCRALLLDPSMERFLAARALPAFFFVRDSLSDSGVPGSSFRILIVEERAFRDYSVTAVPFAYVVTRSGMIMARGVVEEGLQSLERLCDQAHHREYGSTQIPLQVASVSRMSH